VSSRSVKACGTGDRALPRHCQIKAPWRICQARRDRVPKVRTNMGRRGLRSSRRAITGAILSVAEDGDPVERREPPHGRALGTVPPPGVAPNLGHAATSAHPRATAWLRSASGRERGRYASRTFADRRALHELRQVGRCRVPAVR
jgi:hypothetical protein